MPVVDDVWVVVGVTLTDFASVLAKDAGAADLSTATRGRSLRSVKLVERRDLLHPAARPSDSGDIIMSRLVTHESDPRRRAQIWQAPVQRHYRH
jgi:hypothetical protein